MISRSRKFEAGCFLVFLLGLICRGISAQTVPPSPAPGPADQLRAKAQAGDAVAQYQLASAYYHGSGVPIDLAQSFAWTLKSAQQGYVKAELSLAWLYGTGLGTTRNELTSFQWYQKAAEQGDASAESIVGDHYYQGLYAPKDPAQALQWYRKAADQDDTRSQQRLAYIYLYGDPLTRDSRLGLTYALCAAGRNSAAASYVSDCYGRGVFVKADPVKAYAYALQSAALGPTELTPKLFAYYKSTLTPDQIEQAQHFQAWLQKRAMDVNNGADLSFDPGGQPSLKIPVRNVMGALVATASVGNQPPANFVIDTGTGLTSLDSRYAAQLGLKSNDYKAFYALGSEPSLTSVSDPTSLSLGGLTWNHVHFCIAPMTMDRDLGLPLAGILGFDLLKQLVVHIDYEHNLIELIDPKSFHPTPDMGPPLPMQSKFDLSLPFVPASLANGGAESKKEDFLFDSGDLGTMSVEPGFWTDNPGVPFTSKNSTAAVGFDGVVVHSGTGLCSALVLGSTRLEQIPVDSRSAARGGGVYPTGGTIGYEVWRRFDVILDYPGKRIFLRKNSQFGSPWRYPRVGVHVVASGTDYKTFTVLQVLPGRPGAQAGFQPGDVILKINDVDHLDMGQIQNAFWTAGDYRVLVQRQGQTIPLNLHCPDDLK
jgi:TPR repeat protein